MILICQMVKQKRHHLLKLKHYNDDFSGWEGKDDFVSFPLVRIEEHAVYFDGLTYEKIDESNMKIYLAVSGEEGIHEELLEYRRVGDEPR